MNKIINVTNICSTVKRMTRSKVYLQCWTPSKIHTDPINRHTYKHTCEQNDSARSLLTVLNAQHDPQWP